jgi:putative inorganic carbon (HCO3(-)) transporter
MNQEMIHRKTKVEDFTCWCTLLAVGLPMVSIAGASIFLSLAILGLLVLKVQQRNFQISFPPVKLPLAFFMATTLVAFVFSPEPQIGLPPINKFWLFALIPLICSLFSVGVILRAYRFLFVLGLLAAIRSIYQVFQFHPEGVRTTGFMGHWMTFSGELMLVFMTLIAYIYFLRPKRILFWTILACVIGVALSLSFTRSIWIATVVGLFCTLGMGKLNWKILTVVLCTLGVLLAIPGPFQRRLMSLWDSSDPSNYARRAIWKAGLKMVAAHPLVGVGPNRVSKVFYDYHDHPEDRSRAGFFPIHLHNNLLQFAAERGIPCAAAWLWLMVKLGLDHWKAYKRFFADALKRTICAVGFITVVVLFVAGQFEFNFGDSEVLMIFLFLVTAPYVLSRSPERSDVSRPF